MHDALRVVGVALEDGKVVPGGGAPEIELSLRLGHMPPRSEEGNSSPIGAFANALEVIPWALAENGGLDAIDVIIQLRALTRVSKNAKFYGIDLTTGRPDEHVEINVIEPLRVKTQAIEIRAEVAST